MVFLPVFKTPQYLSQLISKEQPKGGFAPIFVKKLVLGLILVLDKESNQQGADRVCEEIEDLKLSLNII